MLCEICGAYIVDGVRLRVEGSVIVACRKCVSYGEVVGSAKAEEKTREFEVDKFLASRLKRQEESEADLGGDSKDSAGELVEDYASLIKSRRERVGLKQKDLARLINEPEALVHRIESGRIEPSPGVVLKLQKTLNLRLLRKGGADEDITGGLASGVKAGGRELTLGDLIVVRKKSSSGKQADSDARKTTVDVKGGSVAKARVKVKGAKRQ